MTRLATAVLLAFACALITGGTCYQETDLGLYDTSCEEDDDCVAVIIADVCDCSCKAGAINKASLAEYTAERGKQQCSACIAEECAPCVMPDAICDETVGRCEVLPDGQEQGPQT